METKPEPATEFDHRLESFSKDKLVITSISLGFVFMVVVSFLGLDRHGGRWFPSTMIGVFALLINRMFRYRLTALGIATLAMLAGLSVSLWYDFTGTARPPSDGFSLMGILGGLFVGALIMMPLSIRNKAERRRLAASQPIIEP